MLSPEELQQRLQEQEALLESYYPGQIEELARLVHEEEEVVKRKIEYMARTRNQSKFVIIDNLLTYHRINW